jgi:hypothetical protein
MQKSQWRSVKQAMSDSGRLAGAKLLPYNFLTARDARPGVRRRVQSKNESPLNHSWVVSVQLAIPLQRFAPHDHDLAQRETVSLTSC